jgi:hypothetical protein
MKNSLITKSLIGLSSLMVGFSAQAFLIDFTNGDWNAAQGLDEYEVMYSADSDFYVRLEASPGYLISMQGYDGGINTDYCGVGLLNCSYDGIGIGEGDDEISYEEQLTITFWDTDYNQLDGTLDSIVLMDLYPQDVCGSGSDDFAAFDVSYQGSSMMNNPCVNTTDFVEGGFYTIDTSVTPIDQIDLFGDDFALAALNVSGGITIRVLDPDPISEPETLALFGFGLLGLGMARRRTKK